MQLVKPVAIASSVVWVVGISLVIGSALFVPGTVVMWREVMVYFALAALLIVAVLLMPYISRWQRELKQ